MFYSKCDTFEITWMNSVVSKSMLYDSVPLMFCKGFSFYITNDVKVLKYSNFVAVLLMGCKLIA